MTLLIPFPCPYTTWLLLLLKPLPLLRSTCPFEWLATSPPNLQSPWNCWTTSWNLRCLRLHLPNPCRHLLLHLHLVNLKSPLSYCPLVKRPWPIQQTWTMVSEWLIVHQATHWSSYTVKCGHTSIGSDSGQLQKCKKSGAFKSQAFITSDMEADDDMCLKPLTNDDNNCYGSTWLELRSVNSDLRW